MKPGEEPRPLRIGKLDEFCPVDDFVKSVEDVIPTDKEMDRMFDAVNADKLRSIFLRDPVFHASR